MPTQRPEAWMLFPQICLNTVSCSIIIVYISFHKKWAECKCQFDFKCRITFMVGSFRCYLWHHAHIQAWTQQIPISTQTSTHKLECHTELIALCKQTCCCIQMSDRLTGTLSLTDICNPPICLWPLLAIFSSVNCLRQSLTSCFFFLWY